MKTRKRNPSATFQKHLEILVYLFTLISIFFLPQVPTTPTNSWCLRQIVCPVARASSVMRLGCLPQLGLVALDSFVWAMPPLPHPMMEPMDRVLLDITVHLVSKGEFLVDLATNTTYYEIIFFIHCLCSWWFLYQSNLFQLFIGKKGKYSSKMKNKKSFQ